MTEEMPRASSTKTSAAPRSHTFWLSRSTPTTTDSTMPRAKDSSRITTVISMPSRNREYEFGLRIRLSTPLRPVRC